MLQFALLHIFQMGWFNLNHQPAGCGKFAAAAGYFKVNGETVRARTAFEAFFFWGLKNNLY